MRLWMILRILVLSLLLGSCALKPAQSQRAQSEKHFLWSVVQDQDTLWMLGSIHMAMESLYPLDTVIEQAFLRSDYLAVEMDIDQDTTASQVAKLMAQQGVYSKGDDLSKHVRPELMQRLDSVCVLWDLPPAGMRTLRPWFLALRLGALAVEESGLSSEYGVDLHFMKRARQRNIPVLALESAVGQVGVFQNLEAELEEQLLEWTLDEALKVKGTVDTMFAIWTRGDTTAMEHLVLGGSIADERFAEFKKRLYDDRNSRMTEQIEQWLKQKKKVFVVVGSAHFVGSASIVSLLRQRGYVVAQH